MSTLMMLLQKLRLKMHDEGIRANDLNDPEFDSADFAVKVIAILNHFCDFDTKIFCEMKNREMFLDLNK